MSGKGSAIIQSIEIDSQAFLGRAPPAKQSNEVEQESVGVAGLDVVPDSPKAPPKVSGQYDRDYQYLLNLQSRLARSLKRSEQAEAETYEVELKQLIRAFCSHTDQQEYNQLRITLTCINLLALLLFHKGRELFQKLDTPLLKRFVGRVCTMDIEAVLQANSRIESSVVYLLTLVKFMPEALQSNNAKRYRQSVLQFLQLSSSAEKISYNILKLMFDLQKRNVFEQAEYQRWKVAQLITDRVRGQSVELQCLAYNILLRMDRMPAALAVFEEAYKVSTDPTTTVAKFLTTLTAYPAHLSIELYHYFNRLFDQSNAALPLHYFKLLQGITDKLTSNQFVQLLQSALLVHLGGRWTEIKTSGMQPCYFELYLSLLRKGRSFGIDSMLLNQFSLNGFEEHFIDAVRNCQCRDLYGVLRALYLEFLRGRVPDTINN